MPLPIPEVPDNYYRNVEPEKQPEPPLDVCKRCGGVVWSSLTAVHDPVCPGRAA
jgi:hypothetical protein